MKMGAILAVLDPAAGPQTLADQAREYAATGYDSLWTAQAMGRGMFLADPLLTLSVAASVTERLELGTAILQLPLYPLFDVAHRVASLAQVAGARLTLGVGAGSTEADFKAFGGDYNSRFRTFATMLPALRELLASGHHGDLNLGAPAAVMPRVYFGTWGKGVARAAHNFDGWIASGHYRTPDELDVAIRGYRDAGGGRAVVSTIQVSGKTDMGELRERLQRYAASGFDDAVIMRLPGAPGAEDLRALV